MKPLTKSCVLTLLSTFSLLGACADDGEPPQTDVGGTTGIDGPQPFRDDWSTVTDQPFDPSDITKLNIGGVLQADNYANRGDIEVYYSLPVDRIVVQMRPFTFTDSGAQAQDDYAKLLPWMYAVANPAPPSQIDASDPSARCNGETVTSDLPWQENCGIRVYYEGQAQKLRIGADIRVFLPVGWEGELSLVTQDNVQELDEYPDRGEVTVLDLAGSANIEVDSGNVAVRLADTIEAVPACTAAQNAECASVGWDTADPACSACQTFGRVRVQTRGEQPLDICVDAPEGLWTNATLDNTQPGMNPGSDPLCVADIDCERFGGCDWLENDSNTPWRRRVELNKPAASLEGLGYNLNLSSGACAEIYVADGPADFPAPSPRLQGDVKVCTGCLDELSAPTP